MNAASIDRPAWAWPILVASAAALMLPFALGPTPLQDSHWINLVWLDQFAAEMRAGVAWPRWLPASHDGLGAPVFYFYGPFAFWLAGLARLAGLTLFGAIAAVAAAALAMSGIGTFLMLRQRRARRPLAGALFYVTAPYHLLDFARRGAFAEFTALALLPWLGIALSRALSGRPRALAATYAALILTHLPTALLASLFLLPLLILESGALDHRRFASVALGIVGGIALSAPYLLPALTLQSHVAIAAMAAMPLQHPSEWSPLTYVTSGAPAHLLLFAIGVSLAILALAAWLSERTPIPLALLTLVAVALGFASPLWHVPPLDRVQFPWRLLGIAELVAALLIGATRLPGPRLLLAAAPPLLLAMLILMPSWQAIGTPQPRVLADLLRRHPDVPEYVPYGTVEASARSDAALTLAARSSDQRSDGGVTTVRRFAFPAWQARCGDRLLPTDRSPEGLVRYRGRNCTLVLTTTVAERVGLLIAVLALLLFPFAQFRPHAELSPLAEAIDDQSPVQLAA